MVYTVLLWPWALWTRTLTINLLRVIGKGRNTREINGFFRRDAFSCYGVLTAITRIAASAILRIITIVFFQLRNFDIELVSSVQTIIIYIKQIRLSNPLSRLQFSHIFSRQ